MKTEMKDRIRSRRIQLEITQESLAKRLGVSRVSVTKWENGATKPDGENLHQLALSLLTSPEWLLYGQGDETTDKQSEWRDLDHASSSSSENILSSSIYDLFSKALPEQQAVVKYFLSRESKPTPGWVDSDARAYADSLESKAKKWMDDSKRPFGTRKTKT